MSEPRWAAINRDEARLTATNRDQAKRACTPYIDGVIGKLGRSAGVRAERRPEKNKWVGAGQLNVELKYGE